MSRLLMSAAITGFGLTLLEWTVSPNAHPVVLACDIMAGWSFLVGCVMTAEASKAGRIPILFLATGIGWFSGPALGAFPFLYVAPLVALLVTYPTGVLRRRALRLAAAAGLLVSVLAGIGSLTVAVPLVLTAAALLALLSGREVLGPLRRGRQSASVAGVAIAVAMAGAGEAAALGWITADSGRVVMSLSVAASAVWLAADLRWGGWVDDSLARLVIDLGTAEPTLIRDMLRHALGDHDLVVGYVVDGSSGFVDERGQLLALPAPGAGRRLIPLSSGGQQVGILIRGAGADEPAELADGVAAAAALAVENARLNAAINAQVTDLSASRDRLVAAVEAQRAGLQSSVDERIAPVLADVGRAIPVLLGPDAERLRERVSAIAKEVHDLAAGVGPTDVAIHGLHRAIHTLAGQCPIPVSVSVNWPGGAVEVATAAFFVAAEGLANASKHARATRAWVEIGRVGDDLVVEVRDDGIGGAIVAAGSGLTGLHERLRAIGGTLEIGTANEGGVRLVARLPVEGSSQRRAITDLASTA